ATSPARSNATPISTRAASPTSSTTPRSSTSAPTAAASPTTSRKPAARACIWRRGRPRRRRRTSPGEQPSGLFPRLAATDDAVHGFDDDEDAESDDEELDDDVDELPVTDRDERHLLARPQHPGFAQDELQ